MSGRIVWKFFGAFAFLTLVVVIILSFFISIRFSENSEAKILKELRNNAFLVAEILGDDIRSNRSESVQHKVLELADRLDLRITVIDPEGVVVGDSQKDPEAMDNHGGRLEVVEAIETGYGQSTRFSDTLNYYMKYVAVRVDDGKRIAGIVRFSIPLSEIQLEMRVIYRTVLFGALAGLVAAFGIAYIVSRNITSPIRQMRRAARRIADGDFGGKLRIKSRDELGELAEALNEMAEQLQQKIDNLKKMEQVRTDFVANVSHELKTPLTLIRGYVETLEDTLEDEEAQKFVSVIKKHAIRLGSIIDDLLSLSELELSKDSIDKSQMDVRALMNEVCRGFGHALEKRNQKLSIQPEEGEFVLTGDWDKLVQVFVNLIDNAIKYSKQGGRIDISIQESDKEITVIVADDGIGIGKEHLERVFERFYRVDKGRSRELGGTGLGLGIAKHIVLAHGGRIWIESRLGGGTKVFVALPKQ